MRDALTVGVFALGVLALNAVAFGLGFNYATEAAPAPRPTGISEQLTERMIVNACYARVAFGVEVGGVTSYFTCQPVSINTTTMKKGSK